MSTSFRGSRTPSVSISVNVVEKLMEMLLRMSLHIRYTHSLWVELPVSTLEGSLLLDSICLRMVRSNTTR